MIATLRKTVGRFAMLGGAGLLLYQVVQWRQHGAWRPYPLAIALEAIVHFMGGLLALLPFISPEGVEQFANFQASDLPGVLFRILNVIPLSGLSMVLGYFFVKWEKYLG